MNDWEKSVTPDISFLIPVYNMADTLGDTLESLASIREFPLEIIVIDDGSSDYIENVLVEWMERFRMISNIIFRSIHQLNRGRARALNEGASLASAEYLSFIDADDLVDQEELCKIWRCMKSSPADLIVGQFRIITKNGREISRRFLSPDSTKERIIRRLKYSPLSPVHLNAFLIRRDIFLSIGGMDKQIIRSQDKDAVIRLFLNTDSFRICDSCHYLYKKHPISRKELIQKRMEWLYYRQKLLQKNFTGLPRYGSMFLQGTYDVAKLIYEGVFKYPSE